MFIKVFAACLLVTAFLLPSPVEAGPPYRPPDLEKEIFDTGEVKLDKFDRAGAVNALISVGRDFNEKDDEVDYELRAHALAIASRLDEDNEKLETVLEQLKDDGETIDESADRSRVARRLTSACRALARKKDNDANKACAAYVVDIALRFDPEGEHVSRLEKQREELGEGGFKADWTGMLKAPIRHARNPWDDEEEVFEKKEVVMPAGKAERFANPQNRINGLVVRQLGNGNLAGSASAVNATALTDAGLKDLLFTFNQDVGPMMGGSLEEVIKFLRIRYDQEQNKIPAGYRIELGFQDKYVPKDGPSAAVAFALLLDSLFSGEKIDEDFACTGDMTADGMVQKIGGAAAKIRGATKRGCKIVGIPISNGKEIGDLLLLDGTQQLLDIQIFTLKEFDEAYEISREEKSDDVAETLELFNKIATVVKRDGDKSLANSKVQERLKDVLKRMPNHLSAKLLLEKGQGKNPQILTVGGTINQIEIISSGTLRNVGRQTFRNRFNDDDDDDEVEFDKEAVNDAKEALKELKKLEAAIDERVKKYHKSVMTVCESVAEGAGDDEDDKDFAKRLKDEMDSMQSAYRKMIEDPSVLEDMES
ncbi:MAG: S16 family serine protease [Verrucomicrobiota bacterium]